MRRPSTIRFGIPAAVALAALLGWALACGSRTARRDDRAAGAAPPRAAEPAADPIHRAWQDLLEGPLPDRPTGYRPPYDRHNKRPSRTVFEKFPRNPVLVIEPVPGYDSGHAEYPCVAEVGDSLWMFYAAFGSGGYWSIAAATSRDGIAWEKLGVALEPDTTSDWDSSTIAFPSVVHDPGAPPDERFKLYYAGKRGPLYQGIGLATSPDGRTWTRQGRILSVGGAGDWDRAQVIEPAVLRLGDGYRMYYCGSRGRNSLFEVGLALSQDGRQWVKYPDNPVYTLERRHGRGLYTVDVLPVDDSFILFESSPDPEGFYDIHAVVSEDGLAFDPDRRRLVLAASHDGTWDHVMVYGMHTLRRGDRLYMWFNGMYRKMVTRGGQIGLARAEAATLLRHLTPATD